LFHTEYLYSNELSPYNISYSSDGFLRITTKQQNFESQHIFTDTYDLQYILFLHYCTWTYSLCFCIMLTKITVCDEETASCSFSNIVILICILINISPFSFVLISMLILPYPVVLCVWYDLSLFLLAAFLCVYHVLLSESCWFVVSWVEKYFFTACGWELCYLLANTVSKNVY
jgi:hypothetical protein